MALSETLHQDLALVSDQVFAHVLCPSFVPTGIHTSQRNRPAELRNDETRLTLSQRIGKAMSEEAMSE